MGRRIGQIFLVAALASAGGGNPAHAQTDSGVLVYGITGSESGSYSSTMSRVVVQKLLLDVGATPRKPEFLDAALDGSESRARIWHYIFGAANRQLVEAGLFTNPYAESRRYKGFITVVWHPSLDPDTLRGSPP